MPDETNADQCSILTVSDINNDNRRLSVPSCNRSDEETQRIFKHLRIDYQGGTRRRGFLIKYIGKEEKEESKKLIAFNSSLHHYHVFVPIYLCNLFYSSLSRHVPVEIKLSMIV